jgi:hypothetical protein
LPGTALSIEVKQEYQRSLFKIRKEAVVTIKEKENYDEQKESHPGLSY